MSTSRTLVIGGLVCATVAGCGAPARSPQLGRIYNDAAGMSDTWRNPVIVIPGVLGSKLGQQGTDRVVWGAFEGDYANPEKPDGARLVALPMQFGVPLAELHDDVVPTGVLDDVRLNLLFIPLQLRAYRNILTSLGVGGYRDEELGRSGAVDYGDEHFSCFQFPYDWRRDNVENARRLGEFIEQKRLYVQSELKARYGVERPDLKFDIVAHSMGGLVARYYMRYGTADLPADGAVPAPTWAGAAGVERVILVGTPSAGSAPSLLQLVHDTKIGPFLPTYSSTIVGTFPAMYQLMPRDRHHAVVDQDTGQSVQGLYSVGFWERKGWGLAAPDNDRTLQVLLPDIDDPKQRRRTALDHLEKCLRRAEQFHEALDSPGVPPAPARLHLFAGDAVATPAVLNVEQSGDGLWVRDSGPGDGSVLRSSALMDERVGEQWTPGLRTPIAWSSVRFLFTDHLGLTKDPAFTDNVLYLLLEAPRPTAP